jgi:four helix bundle protein
MSLHSAMQFRRSSEFLEVALLAYEKLDVYQRAIEFLAVATALMQDAKRGDGPLIDQLRRASMSIPLNIAEAAGRVSFDDRARFYSIARGSAMECSAILDVCRIQRGYDEDKIKSGKELLVRVVEMLTKMCR